MIYTELRYRIGSHVNQIIIFFVSSKPSFYNGAPGRETITWSSTGEASPPKKGRLSRNPCRVVLMRFLINRCLLNKSPHQQVVSNSAVSVQVSCEYFSWYS